MTSGKKFSGSCEAHVSTKKKTFFLPYYRLEKGGANEKRKLNFPLGPNRINQCWTDDTIITQHSSPQTIKATQERTCQCSQLATRGLKTEIIVFCSMMIPHKTRCQPEKGAAERRRQTTILRGRFVIGLTRRQIVAPPSPVFPA